MSGISRALVTGGAGFIGSHIVDELLRRGIETWVFDNFSTGSMSNLRNHLGSRLLRVCFGDLSRMSRLPPEAGEVDVVFHEAAIASVPESVAHPMVVHDANVNGTLNLMNLCINTKAKRLVFASTAAVYGRVSNPPASEENLCFPTSPYGASKLSVENYLSAYRSSYGLETVVLRYFNVYGPRQRMNDDYSGVITIFAKKLLQRQIPTIFGDGRQSRDFVNVKDVVNANMLAMESKAAIGETFNVATGRSVSILELLESLKFVTGTPEIRPQFAPPRPGDVRVGSASISKISGMLGYRPAVTLSQGLAALVDYMKGQVQGVLYA